MFFSFSAYLIPFWIKIMPEIGFLIFWIVLLFFSQFSSLAKFEQNSGLNFFFPFFGLCQPILAKNNAGKRFFNFLNFFAIFFGIFVPELSMNGIRDYNFFHSFSANLIPFLLKIMSERSFLIFWIFLLFFSEFSCRSWVWTEFGSKIFFSLSRPISSRFV